METKYNAQKSLIHSRQLLEEGDYTGSLKENQRILSLFVKGPPGDEALFNIGLIYAHYANPDKDYKKSLNYFNKLINEHPRSPLSMQAKIWVYALDLIKKKEVEKKAKKKVEKKIKKEQIKTNNYELLQVRAYLNQSKKLLALGKYKSAVKESLRVLELPSKDPYKDEALFNIALVYAHYNNPEKDYKTSIEYFSKLIKDFPRSHLIEQTRIWLDVLNVIEKAKQIDIEIEKKKKEMKE